MLAHDCFPIEHRLVKETLLWSSLLPIVDERLHFWRSAFCQLWWGSMSIGDSVTRLNFSSTFYYKSSPNILVKIWAILDKKRRSQAHHLRLLNKKLWCKNDLATLWAKLGNFLFHPLVTLISDLNKATGNSLILSFNFLHQIGPSFKFKNITSHKLLELFLFHVWRERLMSLFGIKCFSDNSSDWLYSGKFSTRVQFICFLLKIQESVALSKFTRRDSISWSNFKGIIGIPK